MNRVCKYQHIETGNILNLVRAGDYYHDESGKVYHLKEVKVLYKFLGYMHNRAWIIRSETFVNINGFKVRKYKKEAI